MTEQIYVWMSFADPARPKGQRFLGVVITRAPAGAHTLQVADTLRAKGLNPGGEIVPSAMSIHAPIPESYIDRLLTREECEAVEAILSRSVQ